MKKRILIYFEDSSESPFGFNDLLYLSRHFERTVVFGENKEKPYPAQVELTGKYLNWEIFSAWKIVFSNVLLILEIFGTAIRDPHYSPGKTGRIIKNIVSNIFRAEQIQDYLKKNRINSEECIFYSFWFYDSLFLAVLGKKLRSALVLNRAHGGDIFEDQTTLFGKVLMRKYILKYINHVITVSKDGADYLKQKYPEYSDKIGTQYLGTKEHAHMNPFPVGHPVFLSCSHVRDIKRVDKIAKSVLSYRGEIEWIHIGSENDGAMSVDASVREYHHLKMEILQKKNIFFRAIGAIDNEAVFALLAQQPVSVFISLSETEGLPVSMMEAISFGIPVLTTDAGGCREIATEKTGMLLPLDVTAEETVLAMHKILNSPLNTAEHRKVIKTFWAGHFNIENNYKDFAKKYLN